MHKATEEIIDRLIGTVKADKPYYTLKDLLSAGFPSFIVERIRIEVAEKLREEFKIQESEWVDIQHTQVNKTWNDFQKAIINHARIPRDRFYEITSSVMSEIIKVYLEPRQYMADYIYRNDEELGYDELIKRTNKLTIYKHFSRAIPMYMNKRKLKTLDKQRCKMLVHNLDANLVASYTAEDWAQVLTLLFKLFGGKVDPELLNVFFGAKGLYLTANQFQGITEEINKEDFIRILSDPAVLDPDEQEKHKEAFLKGHPEQKDQTKAAEKNEEELDENEQQLFASFFNDNKENYEELEKDASFNALFKPSNEDKSIAEEFEEEAEEPPKDEKDAFRENMASVLNQAASSFNSLSQEEETEEDEAPEDRTLYPDDVDEEEDPAEDNPLHELIADEPDEDLIDEEDSDEEGGAMWQQYLRPDQMDLLMGSSKDRSDEPVLMDDLVDDDVSIESGAPELKDYLIGQEQIFIKDIFSGKKKRYHDALKKIQDFDDWDNASLYIQNEVFTTNKVDMFSDAAVDLTDRLQSYFQEYKS